MALSFGEVILASFLLNKLDKIEKNTQKNDKISLKMENNNIIVEPNSQIFRLGPYTVEITIKDIDSNIKITAKSLKVKLELEEID